VNLYVSNFAKDVTEEDLQELFEHYGDVKMVTIYIDFETGESRGFGFVHIRDDRDGREAIDSLDGTFWHGKHLKVSEAQKRRY
jgi:RNA recognition motif-containing protein